MEPVTLTTSRLLLRPLVERDIDAVFTACQNPDIQRWTNVPTPYLREHARDFVLRICPEGWRTDTLYNFGVFTGQDALVGTVGLVRCTLDRWAEGVAELGYWTAEEHRGHGFTSEAARAVAHWTFTGLKVERLEWFAEAGNAASWAVARAVGFRSEGLQRARLLHQGTRRDAWAAALLPSDLGLPCRTPYLPARTT